MRSKTFCQFTLQKYINEPKIVDKKIILSKGGPSEWLILLEQKGIIRSE